MEREQLCEKCRQIEFSALSTPTLADIDQARKDISREIPLSLQQATWRGPGEPPKVDRVNLGSLERIEHSYSLGCKLCAVILDAVRRQGGFTTQGVSLPRGDEVHFWAIPSETYGFITDSLEDIESRFSNAYFMLNRLLVTAITTDTEESVAYFHSIDQPCNVGASCPSAKGAQLNGESDRLFLGRMRPMVLDVNLPSQWIKLCESTHGASCYGRGDKSLKTRPFRLRLIDVNQRCIRFFENYDPSESHAAFAALSYVWGLKPQRLLLTAEKEPMLSKPGAICNTNVSQTIYDAIEVTKSLGLNYLWVDAICIRQGKTPEDERDKKEQIENMAEVYRSAFLTIIAASGEDAEAGLAGLRPGTRSFQQQEIVVIPPDQDQPGLSLLSVCKRAPNFFGAFFDMQNDDVDNSKWNTRGWTLQERALSRRNLIFTQEQVMWVCDGAYFSEETAFEHPINEIGHLSEGHTPIRFELLSPRLIAANFRSLDGKVAQIVSSPRRFWNKYTVLVLNFTIRSLGYPGDIHDAFVGIMRAMQRTHNEHFHWGHPRSRFELSLSWFTFYKLSIRSETSTLSMTSLNTQVHFPTWSWMGWVGEAQVTVSDERLETETPTVLCFGHKSNPLRLAHISDNNGHKDTPDNQESQELGQSTGSEVNLDDISEHLPELTEARLLEIPDEHVLFFWASTAFFAAPMSDVEEQQWATFADYTLVSNKRPVIRDLKGTAVGERNFASPATMEGLDTSSPAEFIAVARREITELDFPATVLALQIKWVDGVAQRLNYAEIDEAAWEEASPEWKLIALG